MYRSQAKPDYSEETCRRQVEAVLLLERQLLLLLDQEQVYKSLHKLKMYLFDWKLFHILRRAA